MRFAMTLRGGAIALITLFAAANGYGAGLSELVQPGTDDSPAADLWEYTSVARPAPPPAIGLDVPAGDADWRTAVFVSGAMPFAAGPRAAGERADAPVPAAVWLFGSAIVALLIVGRQRKQF